VQDHIGNGVEIKRGKILGRFDSPGADGAGSFKGQEALVAQIGSNRPASLLPALVTMDYAEAG